MVLGASIQLLRMFSNLRDPAELDYGEGIILFQATQVLNLKSAFHPLEQYPHVVFHYTPLYHLAVRAVMAVLHDPLLSGRLVSLMATLWLIGLFVWTVLRATRRYAPDGVRWYAAALTGAWVLLIPTIEWSPLARVNMLGLAFQFTALSILTLKRFRLPGQVCAFGLLLLGLYTKQTMVAIPAASVILIGLIRPARALWLACGLAAAGSIVLLILAWATGGMIFRHWILYNVNPFRLKQALTLEWEHSRNLALLIGAGLAAFWLTVPAANGAAWRNWSHGVAARLAKSPLRRTGLGFGLVAILGFFVSWGIGKDGANMNYCLDWQLALCPLFGIFIVLLLRHWSLRDRGMRLLRPAFLLAMGATALAIGVQTLIECNNAAAWTGLAHQHRVTERQEDEELVKFISGLPGPVVSENMTLLLRAGKPVPFEPAIIKQTTETGVFDERELVQRTSDKFFDAFVLYTGTARMTQNMWNAIRQNYHSSPFAGGTYTVYLRN